MVGVCLFVSVILVPPQILAFSYHRSYLNKNSVLIEILSKFKHAQWWEQRELRFKHKQWPHSGSTHTAATYWHITYDIVASLFACGTYIFNEYRFIIRSCCHTYCTSHLPESSPPAFTFSLLKSSISHI